MDRTNGNTHVVPVRKSVSAAQRNYLSDNRINLGNYLSADTHRHT